MDDMILMYGCIEKVANRALRLGEYVCLFLFVLAVSSFPLWLLIVSLPDCQSFSLLTADEPPLPPLASNPLSL